MMKCYHDWMTTGIENQVTCKICGAHGTVAVQIPSPTHLELARDDYNHAIIKTRGDGAYLARLEGAIGHVISHLEEEKRKGRSPTETIDHPAGYCEQFVEEYLGRER